jgi:hypothetical protein
MRQQVDGSWAVEVEVFLDGAETKSEDCQTGAGTCVLNASRRFKLEANVASP